MKKDNKLPIASLRDSHALTQRDMAEIAQCTEKTYRSWAAGNPPNAFHLVNLASHFGVSSDYLLGLSDIPSKNMDVRALHDDIGFSERAAQRIIDLSPSQRAILSLLIEQDDFVTLLDGFEFCLNYAEEKNDLEIAVEIIAEGTGRTIDSTTIERINRAKATTRKAVVFDVQSLAGVIAKRFIEKSEQNAKEASKNG